MWRDPELPNGFQDAVFEVRELEEKARRSAAARKRGKCDHGWRQGKPGSGPRKPEDLETCLHCGKVATREELGRERQEILG